MIWMTTALAGFGGAEVAVVAERDGAGSETLLDAQVVPWQTQRGSLELSLVPLQLSWGVLGAAESEGRLDHLELSAVRGQADFGSAGAWFEAGMVRIDQDLGVREVGLAGGGMGGRVLDDRLDWGLGADLHARLGESQDLYVGLPIRVGWHQPLPYALFASSGIELRPSFGVVGAQQGAVDGRFIAEAGYHAIDEEQASLDIVAGYTGDFDTLVEGNVHRVGLGARASF